MSLIIVYITAPTKQEAKRIAGRLLEKKLIACAVIFNADSMYHWKGKIANEKEFILLCKTNSGKYNSIIKEVEKIHPYDIPCIIKIPAKGNEKYEKWVKEVIK